MENTSSKGAQEMARRVLAGRTFAIDQRATRDLSAEVLDENSRMRVLPAAYWATTTVPERALFGHLNGIYSFPTTELVAYLREVIDGRNALEIGAGNGVLAETLGIPGTDSYQQDKPPYRQVYEAAGQPRVRYGPNVIDCDASRAVRCFTPEVVIGCWVTHLSDPIRHRAGGNEVGVDEEFILSKTGTYVVVGNEWAHRHKKIWARPHSIEYPPFVFSRASNGGREFIATWRGTLPG